MTNAGEVVYLDSSGIVKLVHPEPESLALGRYLARWPRRASCDLARVEVFRAARLVGLTAVARVPGVLQGLNLIALDQELLDDAARLGPPRLRTLDAIHLAAALTLGAAVGRLVTYDLRMAQAANDLGFVVDAPA